MTNVPTANTLSPGDSALRGQNNEEMHKRRIIMRLTERITKIIKGNFFESLDSRINEYYSEYFRHASANESRNIHDANNFLRDGLWLLFQDLMASVISEVDTIGSLWEQEKEEKSIIAHLLDQMIMKLDRAKEMEKVSRDARDMLEVRMENLSSVLSTKLQEPDINFQLLLSNDGEEAFKAVLTRLSEKLNALYEDQKEIEALRSTLAAKDAEIGQFIKRLNGDELNINQSNLSEIERLRNQLLTERSAHEHSMKQSEIECISYFKNVFKAQEDIRRLESELKSKQRTIANYTLEHHERLKELNEHKTKLSEYLKRKQTLNFDSLRSMEASMIELQNVAYRLNEQSNPELITLLQQCISEYIMILKNIISLEKSVVGVLNSSKELGGTISRPILQRAISELIDEMRMNLDAIKQISSANSSQPKSSGTSPVGNRSRNSVLKPVLLMPKIHPVTKVSNSKKNQNFLTRKFDRSVKQNLMTGVLEKFDLSPIKALDKLLQSKNKVSNNEPVMKKGATSNSVRVYDKASNIFPISFEATESNSKTVDRFSSNMQINQYLHDIADIETKGLTTSNAAPIARAQVAPPPTKLVPSLMKPSLPSPLNKSYSPADLDMIQSVKPNFQSTVFHETVPKSVTMVVEEPRIPETQVGLTVEKPSDTENAIWPPINEKDPTTNDSRIDRKPLWQGNKEKINIDRNRLAAGITNDSDASQEGAINIENINERHFLNSKIRTSANTVPEMRGSESVEIAKVMQNGTVIGTILKRANNTQSHFSSNTQTDQYSEGPTKIETKGLITADTASITRAQVAPPPAKPVPNLMKQDLPSPINISYFPADLEMTQNVEPNFQSPVFHKTVPKSETMVVEDSRIAETQVSDKTKVSYKFFQSPVAIQNTDSMAPSSPSPPSSLALWYNKDVKQNRPSEKGAQMAKANSDRPAAMRDKKKDKKTIITNVKELTTAKVEKAKNRLSKKSDTLYFVNLLISPYTQTIANDLHNIVTSVSKQEAAAKSNIARAHKNRTLENSSQSMAISQKTTTLSPQLWPAVRMLTDSRDMSKEGSAPMQGNVDIAINPIIQVDKERCLEDNNLCLSPVTQSQITDPIFHEHRVQQAVCHTEKPHCSISVQTKSLEQDVEPELNASDATLMRKSHANLSQIDELSKSDAYSALSVNDTDLRGSSDRLKPNEMQNTAGEVLKPREEVVSQEAKTRILSDSESVVLEKAEDGISATIGKEEDDSTNENKVVKSMIKEVSGSTDGIRGDRNDEVVEALISSEYPELTVENASDGENAIRPPINETDSITNYSGIDRKPLSQGHMEKINKDRNRLATGVMNNSNASPEGAINIENINESHSLDSKIRTSVNIASEIHGSGPVEIAKVLQKGTVIGTTLKRANDARSDTSKETSESNDSKNKRSHIKQKTSTNGSDNAIIGQSIKKKIDAGEEEETSELKNSNKKRSRIEQKTDPKGSGSKIVGKLIRKKLDEEEGRLDYEARDLKYTLQSKVQDLDRLQNEILAIGSGEIGTGLKHESDSSVTNASKGNVATDDSDTFKEDLQSGILVKSGLTPSQRSKQMRQKNRSFSRQKDIRTTELNSKMDFLKRKGAKPKSIQSIAQRKTKTLSKSKKAIKSKNLKNPKKLADRIATNRMRKIKSRVLVGERMARFKISNNNDLHTVTTGGIEKANYGSRKRKIDSNLTSVEILAKVVRPDGVPVENISNLSTKESLPVGNTSKPLSTLDAFSPVVTQLLDAKTLHDQSNSSQIPTITEINAGDRTENKSPDIMTDEDGETF